MILPGRLEYISEECLSRIELIEEVSSILKEDGHEDVFDTRDIIKILENDKLSFSYIQEANELLMDVIVSIILTLFGLVTVVIAIDLERRARNAKCQAIPETKDK
jgi:hypothetical protein